jgi:hypothetical protein
MNGVCWYLVSAGPAGAGHCRHSAQAGGAQARSDDNGGTSAQPAAIRIATSQNSEAGGKARTMWVIYLEMGVALALLVLIVWFTWPRKRPDDERPPGPRQGGE